VIHKLLLAAALCLGVTTLAFAQPRAWRPAGGFQRPVSVSNVRVVSPNRIVYRPGTTRACGGQGSCTAYKTTIDRTRFSQYYRYQR
jgi:hypothetical protein